MIKNKRNILKVLLCGIFVLCLSVGLTTFGEMSTTAYAATLEGNGKYKLDVTANGASAIYLITSNAGSTVNTISDGDTLRTAPTKLSVVLNKKTSLGRYTYTRYVKNVSLSGNVTYSNTETKKNTSTSSSKTVTYSLPTLTEGYYTLSLRTGADYSGVVGDTASTITFNFYYDNTVPTISGASPSETGKYTNTSTYVAASDFGSGVQALYMKKPSESSFSSVGENVTVKSNDEEGLYVFYAKDKAGLSSANHYLYLDTTKPTGTIKNGSGTAITGNYVNQAFSYSATDSGGGISYLQYKTPNATSWSSYTSGTSISTNATNGTYQFRAVDKAGNISATKSVTLDSVKPTMTMYSGTTSVSSGYKSTAQYIKATASDGGSGVKTMYVKKPNATSYAEYTSGTELTTDGAYSFYCVDNAGNTSQTYTISKDCIKPTLTSSVGGFGKTLKDGFTVTASDNFSGATLYYKTPNGSSFVSSTASSVSFSKTAINGTYSFYAVDGFGNKTDTYYMYISIDAPEATIVKSDNSHKVCVIWTESNCSATLNGESYTSGTWIEQEGEYTFVITNDSNRSTTYNFTVDHYYLLYTVVQPTCVQKGYTIYKCTGCGDSYNGNYTEATGHDYESEIILATCSGQGYTRFTCKTCGSTYADNYVAAYGHSYGEWTVVKEANCTEQGKEERICSVCSHIDERAIDVLGHSYKETVVDPSCTNRGNTVHECERCGQTYIDTYTEATGHNFGAWTSLTQATCTVSGVDKRKCVNCPQSETRITSPLGHDYEHSVVEPTCTEQGYTTQICSRCEVGYNDTFVSPLGHDYEEIEVVPTCTEEGYRGKQCRRCEDVVKTEILKAVGHKFTDSYFIATCEEEGYTLHVCLSCGNEYKDNIVAALGHEYETEVAREPHCESDGERRFHCTRCDKDYYSDIPATGHNYELIGTEEIDGKNVRTYICTNCGEITTQNMGDQYEQVSSYVEYLFEQYRPYMWWVLLATAGVWSIVMGVFFAIAQKNEDKEKARKMIKNYVIGLVVIAVILVACPYLVKGIAALISG